jgi:COX assembly protein 2
MHPPLDRPHPDCERIIAQLRDCHDNFWKKYTGGCNGIKVEMDRCLREEKRRLLSEMNADFGARRLIQEEVIKKAFGREETFTEYLAKDKRYLEEVRKRKAREEAARAASAASEKAAAASSI